MAALAGMPGGHRAFLLLSLLAFIALALVAGLLLVAAVPWLSAGFL